MSEAGSFESSAAGSQQGSVTFGKPGDEDAFENGNSFQVGIFGVLYTVSKEKSPSVLFIAFRLFIEWLQLFLLLVNFNYGFNGLVSPDKTAWYVISFVGLNQFMTQRGYTFFIICLYVMVVGLAMNVLLCAYVANSFKNNRFDHVWPITLLRWYSLVFFQILEVATLTFFLIALDCQYFGTGNTFYNQEFPEVYCWKMPHMAHAAAAGGALVVFVGMALLFTMGEMELNPTTQNFIAISHTKVEVISLGIKVVMTVVSTFLSGNLIVMSVFQAILSFWLASLYIQWLPHTFNALNIARSGSFASIFYCALCLFVLAIHPGVDMNDWEAVNSFRTAITTAMWAGLAPSALVGAGLAWWRVRFFSVTLMNRFRTAPKDTKSKLIYKFTDPREVEIMVRCCRHWTTAYNGERDEEELQPHAVADAEMIVKAGLSQLQGQPWMIILASSFQLDVLGSYQSGYSQLQAAKKLDPNFLERFAIFSREQEQTQKESGAKNGGSSVDLVSYVEFQRNLRLVLKVHREALAAIKTVWQLLLKEKVYFTAMVDAIKRVDVAVRNSERVYRQVLNRHPNSSKLLTLYARFLADVKNDAWAAAKWQSEAEKQEVEDNRNSNQAHEVPLDPKGGSGEVALQVVEARMVVITSANGIIQVAQGSQVLGYDKKELVGKNISIFMPQPFADQHPSYVRSHLVNGRRTILDQTSDFVILHKDRSALSMQMTVSHMSGVGEDSVFMAVIIPTAPDKTTAKAWLLPSGHFMGVDSTFIDWLGYRPNELVGASIAEVIKDPRALESVFNESKRPVKASSAVTPQASTPGPDSVLQRMPSEANMPGGLPSSRETQPHRGRLHGLLDAVGLAPRATVEEHHPIRQHSILPASASIIHKLQDQWMTHKHTSDPLRMSLAIRPIRIGHSQGFALSLQRREPEQFLMVTDGSGRIRHVTNNLAAMLDSTPAALLAEGAINALDAVLPEPYAQIHANRRQETNLINSVAKRSPTSCMLGAPVCLRTLAKSQVEQSRLLPVKLEARLHQTSPTSDVTCAIKVKPLTMDQALNERRLKLIVDGQGIVVSVGSSPDTLFGFDVSVLVGKPVGAFVDVFRHAAPPGEGAELSPMMMKAGGSFKRSGSMGLNRAGSMRGSGFGQGSKSGDEEIELPAPSGPPLDVASALVRLAERSVLDAGTSWRVGVLDPIPIKSCLKGLGVITDAVWSQKTTPAAMTLHIKESLISRPKSKPNIPELVPVPMLEDWDMPKTKRGSILLNSSQVGAVKGSSPPWQSLNPAAGAAMLEGDIMQEAVDMLSSAAYGHDNKHSMPPALGSDGYIKSAPFLQEEDEDEDRLLFEMELWRADLLSSVVEVDANGNIIPPDAAEPVNPMCPAGLATGAGLNSLSGHISRLVPAFKGRSSIPELISAFSDPSATLIKASMRGGRQGAKVQQISSVQTIKALHQGDSALINLTAQVVLKNGTNSRAFVVFSVDQPQCGRPDFCVWLKMPFVQTIHVKPMAVMAGSDGIYHAPAPRIGSFGQISALPNVSITAAAIPGMEMPHATAKLDPNDVLGQLQRDLQDPDEASPRVQVKPKVLDQIRFQEPDRDSPRGRVTFDGIAPQASGMSQADSERIQGWLLGDAHAHDEDNMDSFKDNRISPDAFGKPKKSAGFAEASPDGRAPPFSDSDEEADVVYAADHAAGYEDVDEAATNFNDSHALYKRGKRVGKLTKLLGNQQNVSKIQRFKTHIIGTVILLFVAHICCFVAMVMLIHSIEQNVNDLHSSAFASRKVFEMAINTQAINILLQNYTYGDQLMNGFISTQDLIAWVDDLEYVSSQFKKLHQGVYLGFEAYKRLPTKLGLADLWEKPSLNITMYYDTDPEMTKRYIQMGLWDAGNLLLDKARMIWTMASEAIIGDAPDYGAEDTRVVDISLASVKDTAAYHFVMTNAPNVINKEYLKTLDLLTELTTISSETVNTVHLIIIALDGLVLVAIAALYTYYLTTQVVNMRYNVYSCFLLIPKGIVKAQAERKENLEDVEEDDDDNVEVVEEAADHHPKLGDLKAQPLSTGAPVAINMNRKSAPGDSELASSNVGFFHTIFDLCCCCFRSNKVHAGKDGTTSKRKLIKSRWNSFNLVWPFLIWSAVVVIMNSINYVTMVPLGVSLGLLNTVHFNLLRHHFFFFFSMEYVSFNSGVEAIAYHQAAYLDPSLTVTPNARYRYEVQTFEDEYTAMLYGGAAVPSETGIHWQMVKTGVATSKNNARAILYGHGVCLCEDQSACQEPTSPFYDVTRSGLDALLREYFIHAHDLFDSTPSEAQLNSTAYNFIVTLGQADIEGGLVTASEVYFHELLAGYSQTFTIQIIQVALLGVIGVLYIFFMVLPYIKSVKAETSRVADLLAQVPAEIDIEAMVAKKLEINLGTPANAAGGVSYKAGAKSLRSLGNSFAAH